MKKHEIVRLFLSTLALASSLAVSILSVSTSSASATPALPHLTLSNLPNQNWEVAGAGFPAGQSGLLEVYAVGAYVTDAVGFTTSPYRVVCGRYCLIDPGGALAVTGPVESFLGWSIAEYPLECGLNYVAKVVYNLDEGGSNIVIDSNFLTEPACPGS